MARQSYGKKEPSPGIRLSAFPGTKGGPLPVYVLFGTDPYLLDEGRREVRRRVIADADPEFAVLDLIGMEAQISDILDALHQAPFLSPRRLVIVREADRLIDKKETREPLEKYLQAPSPVGTLCIETGTWNAGWTFAKRVAEVGLLVCCKIADIALMPRWLAVQAKSRFGKNLTPAAAGMLVEFLGPDFASLLNSLSMLALYVADAPSIDTADVDLLVARGHHETVWKLCDAVAAQNVGLALELLDVFMAEGMAAAQLVGILRPTLRQLALAASAARRMTPQAAAAQAGVPYFARDRIVAALRHMTFDDVADAYQAVVDADLEAKTGASERMVMESLVHRLCNRAARRSAAR